jgi:hypothetical protein
MTTGKVRVIVCVIEADADAVGAIAEAVESIIRQAAPEQLSKPEPTPMSRSEHFHPSLYPIPRRHRTTTQR